MQSRPVTGLNVLTQSIGLLSDFPRIARGLYYLASAKADKFNSIGALFETRARQFANKSFIYYEDQHYTYQEMNEWSNQIAHYLVSEGVVAGDIVAVMIENRPEVIACVLALVKLGAIASMINTTQREKTLVHSLTTVKPKLYLIGDECIPAFEAVRAHLPVIHQHALYRITENSNNTPSKDYKSLLEQCANHSKSNPLSSQTIQMKQPAYYIFTSGTTGMPKASVLTHFRWIKAMGAFGLATFRLRSDDIFYVCLPFYHNNALTVSWASVVGAGASMAITKKFSASRFWDDCRRYKVTTFCYIGELCRYLLNQPKKENDADNRIRVIGGNGLRPDIWMEFKQRFNIERIVELYAASECNIAFVNSLNLDKTAGFCPMSYDVVEYDIEKDKPVLDEKGFMKPVSNGESGLLVAEITERSPFEGYTNSEANKKKVLNDVFKTGDQYFNSGDIVLKQGWRHIAFVDRLGDTFRWKGENVATTEVEEEVNLYEQIENAVVYGVQLPHCDGRAGMAAVTLNTELNQFDSKAFTTHLRNKLPAYAVPLFIRVRSEQTVTGTFKYRKVELKEEGIDLTKVNEPLLVLLPKSDQYEPASQTVLDKIMAGDILF